MRVPLEIRFGADPEAYYKKLADEAVQRVVEIEQAVTDHQEQEDNETYPDDRLTGDLRAEFLKWRVGHAVAIYCAQLIAKGMPS